jgi:hypothetical protein
MNMPPGPESIASKPRFSYTSTAMPTSRQARARVRPPIPPPMIITFDIEVILLSELYNMKKFRKLTGEGDEPFKKTA